MRGRSGPGRAARTRLGQRGHVVQARRPPGGVQSHIGSTPEGTSQPPGEGTEPARPCLVLDHPPGVPNSYPVRPDTQPAPGGTGPSLGLRHLRLEVRFRHLALVAPRTPGATGPLDAAATELPWRHRQYAGGDRARPLGPLACRPVVLTAVRALVWGAGVRGATRARRRTSLLVGGAIAAGSALFARGQRRGGWVLGPYRIGVGRAGGSSRTKQERPGSVPSPGGWEVPSGVLPMWDWTPPGGGQPRLDRVPTVVRAWYELPFLDRYAHAWMWRHGGWDVSPFPSSPAEDGPGAG